MSQYFNYIFLFFMGIFLQAQTMEEKNQSYELILYNSNNPLIDALKNNNLEKLEQIVTNPSFNPLTLIYDGDEISLNPITYLLYYAPYPYTKNTYACLDLLYKSKVPIEKKFSRIWTAIKTEELFTWMTNKINNSISPKELLEQKVKLTCLEIVTAQYTFFQAIYLYMPLIEIKKIYNKYLPRINQKVIHKNTIFHLLLESFIFDSIRSLFIQLNPTLNQDDFMYPVSLIEDSAKRDIRKEIYEKYIFLVETKAVNQYAKNSFNYSPYEFFMTMLRQLYQDINTRYLKNKHFWMGNTLGYGELLSFLQQLPAETINRFFSDTLLLAGQIAPYENKPIPNVQTLENKDVL